MAVRIRLTRIGRKNYSYYRMAVYDSRTARDGKYLENLGTYDPSKKDPTLKLAIKTDRLKHWIGAGALATESVKSLLKHCNIDVKKL